MDQMTQNGDSEQTLRYSNRQIEGPTRVKAASEILRAKVTIFLEPALEMKTTN